MTPIVLREVISIKSLGVKTHPRFFALIHLNMVSPGDFMIVSCNKKMHKSITWIFSM